MNRAELVDAFAAFPGRLAAAAGPRGRVAADRRTASGGRTRSFVTSSPSSARCGGRAWPGSRSEDDPHWSWTEPGLAPGLDGMPSLLEILTVFAAARAGQSVATVRALDEAGWARFGTHATYGRLDVAGLLRLAIDHDEEHLAGIARG